MTVEQFALYAGRSETRIAFALLILLAIGVYIGFRDGWGGRAAVLILSSVVAFGGMWVFGRQLYLYARTRQAERSVTEAIKAVGGFAPYVFGVYLTFFEGLWEARALLHSFSITYLLSRLVFIYLGYKLVKWTYQLSEIANQLRSGRLLIVDGTL